MNQSFRQAMAWVHTWFGLVLGFVLMAAFFFGALAVFDREIDRWAMPATRFEPQPLPSFEKVLQPALLAMRPRVDGRVPEHFEAESWYAYASPRDPTVELYASYRTSNAKDAEETLWADVLIDPRNGRVLAEDQWPIGSGFFYPLHYGLTLDWKNLGIYIVGFSALMLLAALVTGVVMHRKLFREFFTFRPVKARLRSVLDLHNLTGVVALPFHFFFAFTGLLIFASYYYFPVGETQLRALREMGDNAKAIQAGLPEARSGVPARLANVDAMVAEAQRHWQAQGKTIEVGSLELNHVGDANGSVSVHRASDDQVAAENDTIHFRASSGKFIGEDPPLTPVWRVYEYLEGLHLVPFRHWLLRWLYVLGGLAGAVCIATGFIFFVEKRKRQHASVGSQGARVVDALAVTTVTGMLLATLGILIANRLLPESLPARGEWERYAFWGTWVLALLHAGWRSAPVAQGLPNPAWREQCWAIAAMALAAAVLNWITTGDHLLRTLAAHYWPVAGFDLSLLAVAATASIAARRLKRRRLVESAQMPAANAEATHA